MCFLRYPNSSDSIKERRMQQRQPVAMAVQVLFLLSLSLCRKSDGFDGSNRTRTGFMSRLEVPKSIQVEIKRTIPKGSMSSNGDQNQDAAAPRRIPADARRGAVVSVETRLLIAM